MQQTLNTPNLCLNFPHQPDDIIIRDDAISTISRLYNENHSLILLQGFPSSGKSFLVSQLVIENNRNSFAIFLRPTNRLSYSISNLRNNLCYQACAILGEKSDPDKDYTPSEFDSLFTRAYNINLSKCKNFYFFIDGIDDLMDIDLDAATSILEELVHFDYDKIRILLTIQQENVKNLPLKIRDSATYTLSTVPQIMARDFLKDLDLEEKDLEEIICVCNGLASNLSAVKRLIKNGDSPSSLLEAKDLDSKLPFIQLEWSKLSNLSEKDLLVLSCIAFGKTSFSIDDLSKACEVDSSELTRLLKSISFLEINDQNIVSTISPVYTDLLKNKLKDRKNSAWRCLAESNISTFAKKDIRPEYFASLKDHQSLISYLTFPYFEDRLKSSSSLEDLIITTRLGLEAASTTNNFEKLFKFSVQSSSMQQLQSIETLRAKIESLISHQGFDSAEKIASNAVLKEHKLLLYSILAKGKKEHNNTVDSNIIRKIDQLIEEISFHNIKDLKEEITKELLWVNHDSALKIIDKSVQSPEDETQIDIMFTKLSIASAVSRDSKNDADKIIIEAKKRIKDPQLIEFNEIINIISTNKNAKEVICFANEFKTVNKVRFFNMWLQLSDSHPESKSIIEESKNTIVSDSTYTPKSDDLFSILKHLKQMEDKKYIKDNLLWVKNQLQAIEHILPTEDWVKIELSIADIEYNIIENIKSANDRVVDLYLKVDSLQDTSTKAASLSWILAEIQNIDTKGVIQNHDKIVDLTGENLENTLKQLLNNSADHYYVSKNSLSALAINHYNMAFNLAASLNTQERRDDAFIDIIKKIISDKHPSIEHIKQLLKKIDDSDKKSRIIIYILRHLNTHNNIFSSLDLKSQNEMISLSFRIKFLPNRCQAFALSIALLSKVDSLKVSGFHSYLSLELKKAWENLDPPWLKPLWAYKISTLLSKDCKELANKYHDLGEECEASSSFTSPNFAIINLSIIKLIIRAYAGVIKITSQHEDNYEIFTRLFSFIPSPSEQIRLWTKLAHMYLKYDFQQEAKKIYEREISQKLESIKESDIEAYYRIYAYIAPVIYQLFHSLSLNERKRLPKKWCELSSKNIIDCLFSDQLSDEPYNITKASNHTRSLPTIQTICSILDLIYEDSLLYSIIEKITSQAIKVNKKDPFTTQQIETIHTLLEQIIIDKLPDPDNISHDGYVILSQAQLLRLRKEKKTEKWNELINEAQKIKNLSDKSFVIMEIASILPLSMREASEQLFKEANTIINSIPSDIDRISRIICLGEASYHKFTHLSKKYLQKGMDELSQTKEDHTTVFLQRKIIDVAHRLNPELANELASRVDDDPARLISRAEVRNELKLQEYRNQLIKNKSQKETIVQDIEKLSKSSWLNLGNLNANQISALQPHKVQNLIELSASLSLREAYPVLSFAIQNIINSPSKKYQDNNTKASIFNHLIQIADFIQILTGKINNSPINIDTGSKSKNSKDHISIEEDQREKALLFISDWIEESDDEIIIVDSFFGKNDIELLHIIKNHRPDAKITILTGAKQQRQDKISANILAEYTKAWRENYADDIPCTDLFILELEKSGDSPIHDRWIISGESGLELGTSFKSLGRSRLTSITRMSHSQALDIYHKILKYKNRTLREVDGEKIMYQMFTL